MTLHFLSWSQSNREDRGWSYRLSALIIWLSGSLSRRKKFISVTLCADWGSWLTSFTYSHASKVLLQGVRPMSRLRFVKREVVSECCHHPHLVLLSIWESYFHVKLRGAWVDWWRFCNDEEYYQATSWCSHAMFPWNILWANFCYYCSEEFRLSSDQMSLSSREKFANCSKSWVWLGWARPWKPLWTSNVLLRTKEEFNFGF